MLAPDNAVRGKLQGHQSQKSAGGRRSFHISGKPRQGKCSESSPTGGVVALSTQPHLCASFTAACQNIPVRRQGCAMKPRELPYLAGILTMLSVSPAVSSEAFVLQAQAGKVYDAIGAAKASASQSVSVPLTLAKLASTLPQASQDTRYVPGNASYVMQNGTGNAAVVMQTGNQNLSVTMQQGQRNTASVIQSSGTR